VSESKFSAGDKVIVNGNLVAEILLWDEDADRLTFVTVPAGGGTDTVYGHISQYRVEAFPVAAEEAPAAEVEQESEVSE
jgi:hypothetical protein